MAKGSHPSFDGEQTLHCLSSQSSRNSVLSAKLAAGRTISACVAATRTEYFPSSRLGLSCFSSRSAFKSPGERGNSSPNTRPKRDSLSTRNGFMNWLTNSRTLPCGPYRRCNFSRSASSLVGAITLSAQLFCKNSPTLSRPTFHTKTRGRSSKGQTTFRSSSLMPSLSRN